VHRGAVHSRQKVSSKTLGIPPGLYFNISLTPEKISFTLGFRWAV
jgi:hypothetical protein